MKPQEATLKEEATLNISYQFHEKFYQPLINNKGQILNHLLVAVVVLLLRTVMSEPASDISSKSLKFETLWRLPPLFLEAAEEESLFTRGLMIT